MGLFGTTARDLIDTLGATWSSQMLEMCIAVAGQLVSKDNCSSPKRDFATPIRLDELHAAAALVVARQPSSGGTISEASALFLVVTMMMTRAASILSAWPFFLGALKPKDRRPMIDLICSSGPITSIELRNAFDRHERFAACVVARPC